MNYFKQVITVTRWEFMRFFKPKNEALGIAIMLLISVISYFGGKYAFGNRRFKHQVDDMFFAERFINPCQRTVINLLSAIYQEHFIGNFFYQRHLVGAQ